MATLSAGLMMYRVRDGGVEALLVHHGGPFWQNRDEGAWTIPKGEVGRDEEPLAAACREFQEETGWAPQGPFIDLGSVRQKGGKVVQCWAFRGDCEPRTLKSNTFTMEWPKGSGRMVEFPEVDRAEFFAIGEARRKINPAQAEFLDVLERASGAR